MAFSNSATIDNILLRGLNFRYPNNAPVMSSFSLYMNSAGQAYWSNAIVGDNLSTLSTSLALQNSTLSSMIMMTNTLQLFQTSQISTLFFSTTSLQSQIVRNASNITSNFNTLSNQFITFSNTTQFEFVNYNNTIKQALNAAVSSAITQISSLGPVQSSISTTQGALVSTTIFLKSSITIQTVNMSNAITSTYIDYTTNNFNTLSANIEIEIATLSNAIAPSLTYSTFSTLITNNLLSTSASLQNKISSLSSYTATNFISLSTYTNQTLLSTAANLEPRVSTLEGSNAVLLSTVSSFVWPYVTSTMVSTTSSVLSFIGRNSNAIDITNTNISTLYGTTSNTSTFVKSFYSATTSTLAEHQVELSNIYFAYSTLTASSILVNIWQSFNDLEHYTSSMIGQRYSSITQYENNVYASTVASTQYIATSSFNFYVSTMYNSTLSTLVPSTFAYMSTTISTLYANAYPHLMSTLNSSMSSVQTLYISSMYGLQSSFVFSTQTQVNSSLIGYISSPISTIISYINLSTVSALSTTIGNNNTQSTIFYSTQASYVFSYSTLQASTIATNALAVSTLGASIYTNTVQIALNSTTFGFQLSTQRVQFNSTIASNNLNITTQANSAYSTIVNSTTTAANGVLSGVTASTIAQYSAFTSSLTSNGFITGSTLYANTTLLLTGNTYTQTMDFNTFRNFYVQISSITGGSNYRLTYDRGISSNLNYRKGIISIDVNTVGQGYSSNGGQLRFDVNTLGIPTSVWRNVSPLISSADYLAQYEYTILNSVVWTNLIGLYPRVRVFNPVARATTQPQVKFSGVDDPSTIMRGGPLTVSWSNYSFFPYAALGELPFEPQVVLETYANDMLYNEYLFPFSQSTASIIAPYIVGGNGPLQTATVNMYVLGYPTQTVTTTFKVLQPSFDTLKMTNYRNANNTYNYLGGYEVVVQTDLNNYPVYSATTAINGDPNINNPVSNLASNLLNRAGYTGKVGLFTSNNSYAQTTVVPNNFIELTATRGYSDFLFSISSYRDLIAISSLGGSITLSLKNASVSTTFVATNFSTIVSSYTNGSTFTLYEAFNRNSLNTNNLFTTTSSVLIQYSLSLPQYVSTTQGVSENPFITDANTGVITATLANLNLATTSDPISSLVFYNLNVGVPTTVGASITGSFANNNYTYTFSTTSALGKQVYSL